MTAGRILLDPKETLVQVIQNILCHINEPE